mmetsp:Transcript_30935/g.64572  ORF Transcript_30935/g.64572 Transcript_30935/m.64572 type:complete len:255 (+) Transcript_30935:1860-2624(+)
MHVLNQLATEDYTQVCDGPALPSSRDSIIQSLLLLSPSTVLRHNINLHIRVFIVDTAQQVITFLVLVVIGEVRMINQLCELGQDVVHIIGQVRHGHTTAFLLMHAGNAGFFTISELTPIKDVGADQKDHNDQETSQDRETFFILVENGRNTQEQKRQKNKHANDVNNGEPAPKTSQFSQLACSVYWQTTHEGNGVKDNDTKDVKHQMGQCHLQTFNVVGYHGRCETSNGGTNVGSQGEGIHLFQSNGSHSHQRC